ncbi:YbaB/EbfC family nucleoid-associated protein [Nocardia sp. NPDC019395]|uniref:YbaB/EbfC family nucleoid-associated protein n=1 Tax=Nocardia sp. NPDC019395 TaxID=3154686 RepID=UPI0033CD41A2
MANEAAKERLTELLDTVQRQMRALAIAHQERAALTARASAGDGRVTITVNADGVVIETRFAPDIAELTYDEIEEAVTAATQSAAQEVSRRAAEVFAPLHSDSTRRPDLSEIVPGMPNLADLRVTPPPVSIRPPARRGGRNSGRYRAGGNSPVADNDW